MKQIGRMTRRKFLHAGTAAGLFAAAPLFVPRHVLGLVGTAGANERIVLGIVGMGVRGDQWTLNVPASGRVAAIPDEEPRRGPQLGAVFVGSEAKMEINRNKFTTNPPDFVKNPAEVGSGAGDLSGR